MFLWGSCWSAELLDTLGRKVAYLRCVMPFPLVKLAAPDAEELAPARTVSGQTNPRALRLNG